MIEFGNNRRNRLIVITKKAISGRFWLVMAVMLCAAVFISCRELIDMEPVPGTFVGLDVKTERRIVQNFFDIYKPYFSLRVSTPEFEVNDFCIRGYYGSYHGTIAVMMDSDLFRWSDPFKSPVRCNVDDIFFVYVNHNSIVAWNDGQFYALQVACDLGLLAHEDIISIRDLHKIEFSGVPFI